MPQPKKELSLLGKVRRYVRIQGEISRRYKQLDELEPEVLAGLRKRSKPLPMGRRSTQAATVVDNFAEKNKAFRAHGISRFEVKLIDARLN